MSQVRGTNFIPCKPHYTHNFRGFLSEPLGHWNSAYCFREAEYLAGVGVRHVRLFQSPWGYFINSTQHVENLGQCADILKSFGIGILLSLFDGVHTAKANVETNGYKKQPWYDKYGATGANSWDPTSPTNPSLLNGTDGIFDEYIAKDAAATSYLTGYKGLPLGGGWVGFPGPLYMSLFDIGTYPNSVPGHEEMWDRMKSYITDTITVCETAGILDGVDCFNEPEIGRGSAYTPSEATGYAVLFGGTQPELQAEYKHLLNLDPGDLPGITSLVTNINRWAAFVKWSLDAVAALKPGVQRTVGHVSLDDVVLLYGDAPYLALTPPEVISSHSYGFGHYFGSLDDIRDVLDAHSGLNGKPYSLNEFHRKENGDYHALSSLHYLSRNNLNGYIWEVIGTGTFSQDTGTAWAAGSITPPEDQDVPPVGLSFPTTGFAFSAEIDGTHQITESRTAILQGVRAWFLGESTEEVSPLPQRLRPTLRPGRYALLEDQDGRPWQNPVGWRVVWRLLVADTSSLLPNPRSSDDSPGGTLWFSDARFPALLGLGPFLNEFDQETTTVTPFLDLRTFAWSSLLPTDGSKTLIVHAAIGNQDFLFDPNFDQLEWFDTVPGYLSRTDFERNTGTFSNRTRVRNVLVEKILSVPATELEVNPLTGQAEEKELTYPQSVVVNDLASLFSDATRNRRSAKVERGVWEWVALLRFSSEVNIEHLEEALSRILILRDRDLGLPQVELLLRRADYSHPSQGSAESGTVATLRFEARLSPV